MHAASVVVFIKYYIAIIQSFSVCGRVKQFVFIPFDICSSNVFAMKIR